MKPTLGFLSYSLFLNMDMHLTQDQWNSLVSSELASNTTGKLTEKGIKKAMSFAKRMVDPLHNADYEKVLKGKSSSALISLLLTLVGALSKRKVKLYENQKMKLISDINNFATKTKIR